MTGVQTCALPISTGGAFCETPWTLAISGNPLTDTNYNYWSLSTNVERGISGTGGIINVTASDLSGLTTDNGLYHWVVSGYYGSHPDSRAFRVKK